MGTYLNPSSDRFKRSLNSKIYIDKSGLIEYLKSIVDTEQQYVCVSRPRRFGKSMAIGMLSVYYGYDEAKNAAELFKGSSIANEQSFEERMGKYDCISISV
jgi:hypothetical protein